MKISYNKRDSDRCLWENEEEATQTEMESISYSAIWVVAFIFVVIASSTLLIVF